MSTLNAAGSATACENTLNFFGAAQYLIRFKKFNRKIRDVFYVFYNEKKPAGSETPEPAFSFTPIQ